MWLPTKLQVDSASRHAITIVSTAAVIFGLQAKGVDPAKITAAIQALGPVINDIVTFIGSAGALYAMLKAAHSASPTSQVAAVQSIAMGPASDTAISAQKALIAATSAVAQDKSIPASEEAKNTLVAATIALPEVQSIVTDAKTAAASSSPSVVSAPLSRVS